MVAVWGTARSFALVCCQVLRVFVAGLCSSRGFCAFGAAAAAAPTCLCLLRQHLLLRFCRAPFMLQRMPTHTFLVGFGISQLRYSAGVLGFPTNISFRAWQPISSGALRLANEHYVWGFRQASQLLLLGFRGSPPNAQGLQHNYCNCHQVRQRFAWQPLSLFFFLICHDVLLGFVVCQPATPFRVCYGLGLAIQHLF